MQIVIDIPKEFIQDWDDTKFSDCIKRVRCDLRDYPNHDRMTGKYEMETLDMLQIAFMNGTPLPKRLISIDTIIETLCPKDEDYDYPCICPNYLEHELEQMVLDADRSVEE